MEWNNKYNYPTSTRSIVDGSRHYSVNEERLPSVTTILKATESEEKKASLQAWKQRVGQKQAEIITRETDARSITRTLESIKDPEQLEKAVQTENVEKFVDRSKQANN